ncbi:MAG: DNA repair protein RecO [Bacteroidetes bacterium]|nr:DNA repair protein RecO [Bacteroidota bacterium]
MTHKTKGIVLRVIKYGETSIIATLFTELFGVQTYLVNGIRTSKKTGSKAAMYQPGAILDMEVYHNDLKNMQRIKESNWAYLYEAVFSNVIKNSVVVYMVELIQKTLRQPEQNTSLFYFCEDALVQLDHAGNTVTANYALYFTLHLPQFFGFTISNNFSDQYPYFDLQEGQFVSEPPTHIHYIDGENAATTAEILNCMQPAELNQVKLNHQTRKSLLLKYLEYYSLHIPEFGNLKSLEILHEVLG